MKKKIIIIIPLIIFVIIATVYFRIEARYSEKIYENIKQIISLTEKENEHFSIQSYEIISSVGLFEKRILKLSKDSSFENSTTDTLSINLNNPIKIKKSLFKKRIFIKNLKIKIKNDFELNLASDVKIKELNLQEISILLKNFSNEMIIKDPGLIEIIFEEDNKINKIFAKLDADLYLNFFKKKFSEESNLNSKDSEKFFHALKENLKEISYIDSKIQIFDQDLKLIYDSELFNKIRILNLSRDENFESKNNSKHQYLIDIKKNKLLPLELFANFIETEYSDQENLSNMNDLSIEKFILKILDLELNLRGKIYNLNEDSFNKEDFFPDGEIQINLKNYDQLLQLLEMFSDKDNIAKFEKFIKDFVNKDEKNTLSIKYSKLKNQNPLINEKELLKYLE